MSGIISGLRTFVDGLWAAGLNDLPQAVNPNLRTGITLQLRILNDLGVYFGAGAVVTGTLHAASTGSSGQVEEGAVVATAGPLTTDSLGDVSLPFVATLDVSQLYQLDVQAVGLDGTTDTILEAVLLNPQPGSDWGGIGSAGPFFVNTDLSSPTSSQSMQVSFQVVIGLTHTGGAPVTGESVAVYIAEISPSTGSPVLVASGTTDSTGTFAVKAATADVVPSTEYQVQIDYGSSERPAPGDRTGASLATYGITNNVNVDTGAVS